MGKYCCHCLSEIGNEEQICPNCNLEQLETVPAHHLAIGTVLHERYMVGKAIGEGGFGITYVGKDLLLNVKVAIKEFFPNGYVNRNHTVSMSVFSSVSEDRHCIFDKGKERFLDEARILAMFSREPGIVDVKDFFEANNTAYIVMEYLEGLTLKQLLAQNGPFAPDEIWRMLKPVLLSLKEIHKHNLIHRDISPDNIMCVDNSLKLLDFGAARSVSASANKSLSVLLKPGFAPEEQYRSKGIQGTWTDIYALCATIYKCITGITPDDATERIIDDDLKTPSVLGVSIAKDYESALLKGMSVLAADRFQSIDDLIAAVEGKATVVQTTIEKTLPLPRNRDMYQTVLVDEDATILGHEEHDISATVTLAQPAEPAPKKKKKLWLFIIIIILLLLMILVAVLWIDGKNGKMPTSDQPSTSIKPTEEPAETDPTQPVLLSIELAQQPSKTVYYVGDTLDFSGLTVTATYSSGKVETVTDGIYCTPVNLQTPGTQTITVTYCGMSTSFEVFVNADAVTEITVKSTPKTSYFVGEDLDLTGLVLQVMHQSGKAEDISEGYECAFSGFKNVGEQEITVTYGGQSVSFMVSVKETLVNNVSIVSKPSKTSYYVGDTLSTSGLTLTATYNDGTSKTISSGFSCSPTSLSTAGTQTITVSYGGKKTTFTVNVTAVSLSSLSIKTKPTKTSYYVGDTLNTSGLTLTATYNNGTSKTISSGFSCSPTSLSTAGTQTITVNFEGKKTTFTVNVTSVSLSSLSIKTKPTKTSYYVGDTLSTSGLTLTATYNNGTSKTISSGFSCSPTSLSTAGTQTITVSYGGKKTTFTVNVAAVYTVSWNTGTGYTITVKRTSSPNANASTGTLRSGAAVYQGDVLSISYAASNGYTLTSQGSTSITVTGNVTSSTIYASARLNSYSASWYTETGYSITVKRTSSPFAGASISTLSSGNTVYYGDVLSITYTASTGYSILSYGKTSITVSGNVTSSDVFATAKVNSYTYNVVYVSSNGTNLGSTTATYNYGTTNTISAPAKSGYITPSSQRVTWDSTSAKTITFIYTPTSVAFTKKTGYLTHDPEMPYSVIVQYKNRTQTSVDIRVIWTTSIMNGYNNLGQNFEASIGSVSTGRVIVCASGTWANKSTTTRSETETSKWITVPLSTTGATSLNMSIYYYQTTPKDNLSSGSSIKETWTINIPAF